jgi:serine protease Do/serine protease DegQ
MRVPVVALVSLFLAAPIAWAEQTPSVGVPHALPAATGDIPTLAPLLKRVTPNVVNIATKGRIAQEQNPLFNDPFFRRFFNIPELPAEQEIRSAGSGVIIDAERGLVVTSNHVVEHADEIAVTLTDGRRFLAERIGADAETDVAVIKVPAERLSAIALGDSDKLEVGDFVVAIGNPFGIGQTVTLGIVSALRRTGLGIKGYEDFIQTDAPINPGNSGGALVNLRGELVGINTAIVAPTGGNVGIGFAIPINMARQIAEQLVQHGEIRRGQLGITMQDLTPDLVQAMGLSGEQTGALIAMVAPGSAAERAGLKVGDVITAMDKMPVRGAADVRNRVGLLHIGDETELTILRDKRSITVRATLAAPAKNVVEGSSLSPLLDGADFGPVAPTAAVEGVEIVAVRMGSKAWEAGLRQGDIITSVNQQSVASPDAFAERVKASRGPMLLNLLREGSAVFLVVR